MQYTVSGMWRRRRGGEEEDVAIKERERLGAL